MRSTAGLAGFLILIQLLQRPDLYARRPCVAQPNQLGAETADSGADLAPLDDPNCMVLDHDIASCWRLLELADHLKISPRRGGGINMLNKAFSFFA